MMFSIWGSWSVPEAALGLGNWPGWSTFVGVVVDDVVAPVVDDEESDEDEHAASPTAAAPASAPPRSVRREKAGGWVTSRTVATGPTADNRSGGSVPPWSSQTRSGGGT